MTVRAFQGGILAAVKGIPNARAQQAALLVAAKPLAPSKSVTLDTLTPSKPNNLYIAAVNRASHVGAETVDYTAPGGFISDGQRLSEHTDIRGTEGAAWHRTLPTDAPIGVSISWEDQAAYRAAIGVIFNEVPDALWSSILVSRTADEAATTSTDWTKVLYNQIITNIGDFTLVDNEIVIPPGIDYVDITAGVDITSSTGLQLDVNTNIAIIINDVLYQRSNSARQHTIGGFNNNTQAIEARGVRVNSGDRIAIQYIKNIGYSWAVLASNRTFLNVAKSGE